MSGIQSKNTLHSKKQENAIYNEINQSIKTDLEIIQLRERKDKGIENIKSLKIHAKPKNMKCLEVILCDLGLGKNILHIIPKHDSKK